MAGGSKSKGGTAVEDAKTKARLQAGEAKRGATAKAAKAGTDRSPVGDPSHDSPKRQGDKLEKARDAAAGKSRR